MQTRDEYENNLNKYVDNHHLIDIKTEILYTNALSSHYQMAHIDCSNDNQQGINRYLNLKKLLNNSYQIVYNTTKHELEYSHGIMFRHGLPRHLCFRITDDNWGNITKACKDLNNYDWFKNNEHARHVLQIDPTSFYEMQYFLGVFLKYIDDKRNQIKGEQQEC